MKEIKIINKFRNIFKGIMESIEFLVVNEIETLVKMRKLFDKTVTPDLVYEVKVKDKDKTIFVLEVKSVGQPRFARMAVNQLQSIIKERDGFYCIFCAPFISEETEEICKEGDVGFIDLAGNCYIKFGTVFLNIKGKPNPYPTTRPLKSLFFPKSTRVLRALLSDLKKRWTVKGIAEELNISIGLASNIKKKLLEYEYIKEVETENRPRLTASNPEGLLSRWANNYNYQKNELKNFYSFDDVKTVEEKIADYCKKKNIEYAFTLTSGSSLIEPFLRYNRVFIYIKDFSDDIPNDLGWKEVLTGQNITVLEPYDDGIFYGVQEIDGKKVVSDVQLYLDLQSYKERGKEAASKILENRLREKW